MIIVSPYNDIALRVRVKVYSSSLKKMVPCVTGTAVAFITKLTGDDAVVIADLTIVPTVMDAAQGDWFVGFDATALTFDKLAPAFNDGDTGYIQFMIDGAVRRLIPFTYASDIEETVEEL